MDRKIKSENYDILLNNVGLWLGKARKESYVQINNILIKTYWEIGKNIVEFEQKGKYKAEYGTKLFNKLSKDLTIKYGKGFSRSNLYLIREFYLKYKKIQTVSGNLSWSHYCELINIDDDLTRNFYEKQSISEKWSVRELKRQKNSSLFERLALSKNKDEILKLSKSGQVINDNKDIVKDPYVLEFLNLRENINYS